MDFHLQDLKAKWDNVHAEALWRKQDTKRDTGGMWKWKPLRSIVPGMTLSFIVMKYRLRGRKQNPWNKTHSPLCTLFMENFTLGRDLEKWTLFPFNTRYCSFSLGNMLYKSRKKHVKIYLKRTLTSVSLYTASMVVWIVLPKPGHVLVIFSTQRSRAEKRRAQGSGYCSGLLPGLILFVGRHFDRHE